MNSIQWAVPRLVRGDLYCGTCVSLLVAPKSVSRSGLPVRHMALGLKILYGVEQGIRGLREFPSA